MPSYTTAAHGMRTIDVLRKWCKIEDPEVLASEVVRFETAILNAAQKAAAAGGAGIEVLPGVGKVSGRSEKRMPGNTVF
jgi:hypothetical protein